MTQSEINRAVARATGESLSTIAQRGFSLEEPLGLDYDELPSVPNVIDWDELHEERLRAAA
jgi:hypothetical protein